ncbi:hypothetical protein [Hymenobacter sp.]|jgi:predicted peptidase|uniref:hypothetical protein n=1 Tax=Hymenobacter sp. TaxID=1898978 RepID=UPI002ED77879
MNPARLAIYLIALLGAARLPAHAQKVSRADSIRQVETRWVQTSTGKVVNAKGPKGFAKPSPGHALYFTQVDTVRLPYVVYVPKSYNPKVATRLIVYLHGGVVSLKNFEYKDPDFVDETIFKLAEKYQALVLFPFGRKTFGWVEQPAAFEAVVEVIGEAKKHYHVNDKQVYIGGFSNGGTATFWFADHHPELFAGYYTISARPRLDIGPINFRRLGNQPFYSLHAQNDSLFRYKNVLATYNQHRAEAPGWQLETQPTGSHGIIYAPGGDKSLERLLDKLLLRP